MSTNYKVISSFLAIVCLTMLLNSFVFSQMPDEQKRRIEFVKKLNKNKKKENNKSDNLPVTVDNKTVTETSKTDEEEVIKVETQLIRMDVLVVDQKGNAILGLKANDFLITENKIEQEIGTFSLGSNEAVPRTIVLIMDHSRSQIPYLKTSTDAAKKLVDQLNPQDKMAIVSDDVELLADFTGDKDLLKKTLDKFGNNSDVGKSLQFSALYVSIWEMFSPADLRPIVIFQTDGDQLFNVKSESAPIDFQSPQFTAFTDREMIELIEKSRFTMYSVISGFSVLNLSDEERIAKSTPLLEVQFPKIFRNHPEQVQKFTQRLFRQQTSMDNLAKRTGGFSANLETPDQANAIYERILKGITDRYLIGYYPLNQDRDGKRRNVKIEVRGHPEYTVLGRKFYFAPQEDKNTAK